MKRKRSATATLSEADWRSAMAEEIREARQPKPPPDGFLSFPEWQSVFGVTENAVRRKLGDLVRDGVLERIVIPACDSMGRVTTRPFWGKIELSKRA